MDWGFLRAFDEDLAAFYEGHPRDARRHASAAAGPRQRVYLSNYPGESVPFDEISDYELICIEAEIGACSSPWEVVETPYVSCGECHHAFVAERCGTECPRCGAEGLVKSEVMNKTVTIQKFGLYEDDQYWTASAEGDIIEKIEEGREVRVVGVQDQIFDVHGLTII